MEKCNRELDDQVLRTEGRADAIYWVESLYRWKLSIINLDEVAEKPLSKKISGLGIECLGNTKPLGDKQEGGGTKGVYWIW